MGNVVATGISDQSYRQLRIAFVALKGLAKVVPATSWLVNAGEAFGDLAEVLRDGKKNSDDVASGVVERLERLEQLMLQLRRTPEPGNLGAGNTHAVDDEAGASAEAVLLSPLSEIVFDAHKLLDSLDGDERQIGSISLMAVAAGKPYRAKLGSEGTGLRCLEGAALTITPSPSKAATARMTFRFPNARVIADNANTAAGEDFGIEVRGPGRQVHFELSNVAGAAKGIGAKVRCAYSSSLCHSRPFKVRSPRLKNFSVCVEYGKPSRARTFYFCLKQGAAHGTDETG